MGTSCSNYVDNTLHALMFVPPPINQLNKSLIESNDQIKLFNFKNVCYFKIEPINTEKYVVFSHGNAATIFDYYYYALS